MRRFLLFSLFLTLFISCDFNSSTDDIDTSAISLDFKFNRLELEQMKLTDLSAASAFLEKYPSFSQLMLERSMPSNQILAKALTDMANDKQNQMLFEECQKDFQDMTDIQKDFEKTFKRIKYYYPEFPINEVNTFSAGLTSGYDITLHNRSVFIGIDHFLKDKEKFRPNPQVFHQYMLNFYNPENMIIKVSQLLSQPYNAFEEKDQTMLANMIFYGKAYYFVKKVNPTASNSLILEYEQEEWDMAEKHIAIIWEHFIKKELFYATDKKLVSKYIDPRPKTGEVAEACPGRIGQWLGFKIVDAYMKNHPTITLQELMAEKNSQKIFQESKFRPVQ